MFLNQTSRLRSGRLVVSVVVVEVPVVDVVPLVERPPMAVNVVPVQEKPTVAVPVVNVMLVAEAAGQQRLHQLLH